MGSMLLHWASVCMRHWANIGMSPRPVWQTASSFRRYNDLTLIRFTLTIRKNYRHVPYHNWSHAFSVAHAMFTVLMTTSHEFTHLEVGRSCQVPVATHCGHPCNKSRVLLKQNLWKQSLDFIPVMATYKYN